MDSVSATRGLASSQTAAASFISRTGISKLIVSTRGRDDFAAISTERFSAEIELPNVPS